MRFFKTAVLLSLFAALVACTPAYTQQKAKELATQARLRDGVEIQRRNDRLLSHQEKVCLVSDAAGSDLLRTVQAGFEGYFLAVGVENEPMDYLRAVANSPCPGTGYLFYVQPLGQPVCLNDNQQCNYPSLQYSVTVVSSGDHSLVDRITVAVKAGVISNSHDQAQRVQSAFAQLAAVLIGADAP